MKNVKLNLTAYNLPIKKEAWPVCECCGKPGLNCAEAKGIFSEGESWPVTHSFERTITVFKNKGHVKSVVSKAISLIGNHPMDVCADKEIDFGELLSELIVTRSEDMNQLLHAVHDFEVMLIDLFGDRKEVKEDSLVWAFAYIMVLISTPSTDDTNPIIHEIWDSVMFDSAERARGIRDLCIRQLIA